MFEQSPHIAAVSADRQPSLPCGLARVIGEASEASGMAVERVGHRVRVFAGVGARRGFDEVVRDRREVRLIETQCLLDTECVQRSDVTTVRRVLDRRPWTTERMFDTLDIRVGRT